MHNPLKLFHTPEEAVLVERPNRFTMIVKDRNGRILRAHCPNPGKLTEFTIPGQRLLIERHTQSGRKTDCTAVAVCYHGKIIFLYSAKANDIARSFVMPRLHPKFDIRPEWSVGHSRFDFLLTESKKQLLVEVKSCSLVEHKLAMFPDTATLRGSRHIDELIHLASEGYQGEIVFIISHDDARMFMPNPHTDPDFCLNLHRAVGKINIQAISVRTCLDGSVQEVNTEVPIETDLPNRLAKSNCGIYLLVIHISIPVTIPVPAIGNPVLPPGWYVYIGSARKHLRQRVSRHLRKKKKPHWHIDHLTQEASFLQAFPVSTFSDLECSLAHDISACSDSCIPGFGSSDCSCPSHLMYFHEKPLLQVSFVKTLFHYRHVKFMETN